MALSFLNHLVFGFSGEKFILGSESANQKTALKKVGLSFLNCLVFGFSRGVFSKPENRVGFRVFYYFFRSRKTRKPNLPWLGEEKKDGDYEGTESLHGG